MVPRKGNDVQNAEAWVQHVQLGGILRTSDKKKVWVLSSNLSFVTNSFMYLDESLKLYKPWAFAKHQLLVLQSNSTNSFID